MILYICIIIFHVLELRINSTYTLNQSIQNLFHSRQIKDLNKTLESMRISNYTLLFTDVVENFILSSIYNSNSSNLYYDPINNLSLLDKQFT